MRIEAVHHVEILRQLRRLLRQVVRAAAAQDHHVDLILQLRSVAHAVDGHARMRLNGRGVAPGEQCRQLHVGRVLHGALHAAA